MSDAIVVGSGPNGLACAAVLARAGVAVTVIEAEASIGGGTRTSELTLPGLLHDECSAVHAMAVGAPSLNELELERHGLQWCWPEVDLAHPLDGGGGARMVRSIADTAAGLGADGRTWRCCSAPSSRASMRSARTSCARCCTCRATRCALARFGLPAAMPAALLARKFRTARGAGAVRRLRRACVQPASRSR